MQQSNILKLSIELVPSTSWYSNLRGKMEREEWDRLRRNVYKSYENKCGICGGKGLLHCHEIWEYDDNKHVQTLKGFIALCVMCHHVKHIGLAGILAQRGELDFDKVIKHFMKVNECSREIFDTHYKEAFKIWEERSAYKWEIDLGEYANLIKAKGESND
jgi:hypothetical protein